MNQNERRDTPGRMLALWVAVFVLLVVFAWRVEWGRSDYDWVEYPTALGDRDYYIALGTNDFLEPNLKVEQHPEGWYRRIFNPVTRDDAEMTKVGRDLTNRFFVYRDGGSGAGKDAGVVYLKSGENAFVEFGERKYWPANPNEVPVPRAIPVPQP